MVRARIGMHHFEINHDQPDVFGIPNLVTFGCLQYCQRLQTLQL